MIAEADHTQRRDQNVIGQCAGSQEEQLISQLGQLR